MQVIGALCAGLVWGWLSYHAARLAPRTWRSLPILAVTLAAAAAQQWWLAGRATALPFGAGVAAGAIVHAIFIAALRRPAASAP